MLLGIDVGGTYTDSALYENGKILKISKHPTQPENLQQNFILAIKELLSSSEAQGKTLTRIVIGTTLVTNLLATAQGAPTALILLPGYSLPWESYQICENQFFLNGMVDFRGRVVQKIPKEELKLCIKWLKTKNISQVAVAGKFSNRNPAQEFEVATAISNCLPQCAIILSHQISSRLNFPRRAVTAYYTAMVKKSWIAFARELQEALFSLDISCEVQILKADGGTLPLSMVAETPCETIFSGPAASIMGALALHPHPGNAIVMDVGGTTCDLALIIDDAPLYASRGAKIAGLFTQIDAFSVDSIPLGGDSVITLEKENIQLQPYRKGAAICFGGEDLTFTDVMNVFHTLNIGDSDASKYALSCFAVQAKRTSEEVGQEVEHQALQKIQNQIQRMIRHWENEPAYKVWEVVNRKPFQVQQIIGLGAGAPLIINQTAQKLGIPCAISPYAASANAVGAALVRPTLRVTLHVDTAAKQYTISPPSKTCSFSNKGPVQLDQIKKWAIDSLKEICIAQQIPFHDDEAVFFLEEQFNIISDWKGFSGRIFDVGVQIQPGFINEFTGVIV